MDLETVLFDILSPINASLIIILNIMEIILIYKMKMVQRKISTVFILNLAISDLLLGLTTVLIMVLSFKFRQDSVQIASYLRNSLIQITLMVSVLTNNILTTERFLAVKHPHVYKRITKVQRRNICLLVWFLAIGVILCFFFSGSQDFISRYHEQFIILSSIIVLSLPWPIISYTVIRRIFKRRFSQKRGHSLPSNATPRYATFTDGQRFLVLCLRSFIIFVICWLPYAAFGFFIFIKRDISQKSEWLFPLQYLVHLAAFINSVLNPILYLYTYSFGKLVRRHFRSRRESKMKSTITIQSLGPDKILKNRVAPTPTINEINRISEM